MESTYEDTTKDTIVDDLWKSIRHNISKSDGFEALSVYVNFAHGDEPTTAWYSERKLEKLSKLKRTWDPKEVFSFYNPIPLTWR
jgi:fumiquinazoline A oxidase